MGLRGYVGYLAEPRATQDVDIMVASSERAKAVKAIRDAWPTLIVESFAEVIRFKVPNDPTSVNINLSPNNHRRK